MGGCSFTSFIFKKLFTNSFIVSVNIENDNNEIADIAILADLANCEKISKL